MIPSFSIPPKLRYQDDLYRYSGKTDLKFLLKSLLNRPGFQITFFFRKINQHSEYSPIGLFYRGMYRYISRKYGFQIPLGTKIGAGLYIGHHGTIVINRLAVIGKNCNITHNVTIGMQNRGAKKGYPTIGDNVWIGTGAVIVGSIIVENNVIIAPNAYVNFDVPQNSIVIGNPGKIIKKDTDVTVGYIDNRV
ncbi:MAG TPA: serine acetyltransferase [Dyadobacter sp.]|nr:serine acetyltransferase [Dyadobacter sp.]